MRFASRIEGVFVLVWLAIALVAPAMGSRLLAPIEQFGARLALRKRLCIFLVGIAALLIRVGLLAVVPMPIPHVEDEFSYLLAGDTFAHGRLTNPPHPLSVYFETFHVNFSPTYMSKYPPAQGAALAIGEILGHPWIGVVFSVAVMCGAILWMLQGWLPSRWALLGGILALIHIGIFSYWMNSYWGGAVAATGGALVAGALPRVMHFHRPRDATLLGLGAAILANSRPFEGVMFCLPVLAWLAIWLCGSRRPGWRVARTRIFIPIFAVLCVTVLFMAYYNWRGTGDALLFPYTVNSRTYMSAPELLWQKAKAPLHYSNPQFDEFYTGWSRDTALSGKADTVRHAGAVLHSDVTKFTGFFLLPELCVPLLALPCMIFDRRIRFLFVQFVFCFLGLLLVAWFNPHYAAPFTATTFAILTQGFRHMRLWRLEGRNIGLAFSRVVVLCALVLAPFQRSNLDAQPEFVARARVASQLRSMPGSHLVIVKYSPDNDATVEWVYNAADIDRSHVVWARDIPGVSLEPLLNYYRGRRVWLVDADANVPELLPYSSQIDSSQLAH